VNEVKVSVRVRDGSLVKIAELKPDTVEIVIRQRQSEMNVRAISGHLAWEGKRVNYDSTDRYSVGKAYRGCMGARSTAMTSARGNSSAISMALECIRA
jgi:hypothetical protein